MATVHFTDVQGVRLSLWDGDVQIKCSVHISNYYSNVKSLLPPSLKAFFTKQH